MAAARAGLGACGAFLAGGTALESRRAIGVPPTHRQSAAAPARSRAAGLCVHARLRRRLLSYVLSWPQRADRYFATQPLRKWLWCGISVSAGFYAANIATLSFGALAVNDVFAAVVTLMFCEVVTHFYYTNPGSLRLLFANCFKMGLTASLLADAAKLGS